MPRNRMIKPEFCSDGKLGLISRDARLLYILTWLHSDDYGVITSSERFLLGNCFENDETVTNQMLRKWIAELVDNGFFIEFEADYKKWFKIKSWDKHQKVDRPSKRRNPVFSAESQQINDSELPRETFSEDSEINLDESEREREIESNILTEYLDLWNKSSNTISYNPISSDVKKQLKKKVIAREKSIDNFKELLTQVINKPFLDYVTTGKWLTFDWVMKSSANAEKLLNGAYTDENLYQVNTEEKKRIPKVQSVPKIGEVEVTHKFYNIANIMRTNAIRLPKVLNEDVIYEFNANKGKFPTGFVDQFDSFYGNQLTGVKL